MILTEKSDPDAPAGTPVRRDADLPGSRGPVSRDAGSREPICRGAEGREPISPGADSRRADQPGSRSRRRAVTPVRWEDGAEPGTPERRFALPKEAAKTYKDQTVEMAPCPTFLPT